MNELTLSRRRFVTAAGVTVVAMFVPLHSGVGQPSSPRAHRFGDRIEIRSDGTVHIHIGRIEMGQGLYSAVVQLAAEELDIDPGRIHVAPVDTASAPNEGYTDSSASMRRTGVEVRRAAAEARAALLAMAAQALKTPEPRLSVRDGTVYGAADRHADYWSLIASGAAVPAPAGRARAKPFAQHRLIGQHSVRIDLLDKVTGAPVFIQDLRLPGMLHARVSRPPSYGATLSDLDTRAVRDMGGVVKIIQDGSFVAVVARREEQAVAAHAQLALGARWTEQETLPGRERLFADLRDAVGMTAGPVAGNAARSLEAVYEVPYRMHGSIGPSCALAHLTDDGLTVWSHAQGMYPLRSSLSGLVDLPASRIRCIHVEASGCYGHNGADDAAADAALIALAVPGVPVRLQWSREDEHRWEPYGPAMVMQLSGAVNRSGKISRWEHIVASPPHSSRPGGAQRLLAARHVDPPITAGFLDGFTQWTGGGGYNARPYYDVPAQVDSRFVRHGPLRSSALRGLGAYANVFAIEAFMDELAALAGRDRVAFRLAHLPDERARAVVQTAAARFGWDGGKSIPNRGIGFGFARLNNYGAYVAVAAEVERESRDGAIRLLRAVAAVDCGEVISPEGVRNQIDGAIVQAASWTLLEQVDFDRTRILSSDWDDYPILRITEAPDVEVHLLDQPGEPYLGVGEAAQGPAGAAFANAVASALEKPVRTLPIGRAARR